MDNNSINSNVIENSHNNEEFTKLNAKDSDLWDQIGYHKPIAAFWYNITFTLFGIILSIILFGYLIGFFYPYPESLGMRDIAFGYFSLLFALFDIGTSAVMGRYIPEISIKDPVKMMHLIQYFIWYQMCTGLIQTTAVSIYALYYATEGSLAYTVWIMLIASTVQYPGMLFCFKNIIDTLQYYHYSQILGFITGTVFQNFTNYLFLYLGRIYGAANIAVGEMLGIAIGAAIGGYVDDFFAMLLSIYYFNKIMKKYGITASSCFRRQFTWEEIKPCVIYSLKTNLPTFITGPINYAAFLITVSNIPQYQTLLFLSIVGGSIADTLGWFGMTGITSLVSESYMNDRKSLTQYYISQEIRFNALLLGFWIPLVLILREVMPIAWPALGMSTYIVATIYLLPRLIVFSINRFTNIAGQIMYGANFPNYGMIMGIIGSISDFGLKYLYYVYLKLPYNLSLEETVWLLELGQMPLSLFFQVIAWIYINLKIIRVKIPWAQLLLGICIPSGIFYGILYFILKNIFLPLAASQTFVIAIIPSILSILATLLFAYFPLTSLFGAWDEVNLDEFRKAAIMSGPSKWIAIPVFRVCAFFCKHSRLHDKFGMATEQVIEDGRTLLELKLKNREAAKAEIYSEIH